MSVDNEMILFSHFGELRKKCPKNAQKSLSSSKIPVFRLLVDKLPIEVLQLTSNQKPVISKNGK